MRSPRSRVKWNTLGANLWREGHPLAHVDECQYSGAQPAQDDGVEAAFELTSNPMPLPHCATFDHGIFRLLYRVSLGSIAGGRSCKLQ